jgi:uncharacterized protein (DUF2141 family)
MKAREGFQYFAAFMLVGCLGVTLLARLTVAQSAPSASSANPSSALAVHIVGFRNAKGNVRVKLMRDSNPVDMRVVPIDAKNLTADLAYDNLPQGVYSVALFHDENMNGRLDSNVFGIPSEGYGFSNNPSKGFGPPKPEQTTFAVKQPKCAIQIKVIYW